MIQKKAGAIDPGARFFEPIIHFFLPRPNRPELRGCISILSVFIFMHPRGIKKRRLKKAARSPVKKEAASGKGSKRPVISPSAAPNGPAKTGPWQNLNHLHAPKAMQQTPALTSQGGLGAKPPLEITRSRTRRGARRMPLGAAMETPHPVRGVGLQRGPRCVSIGAAPCFRRRGLGASE